MSSMSSDAPAPEYVAPELRPRRWPYVVAAVALPFLVFGFAGSLGRLAAGLALTVAAVALGIRFGEATCSAGARRAAARTDAIHRGEAL